MADYEYRTVAAPRRVKKIKGVKGKEAQFAVAVEDVIREQAAEGWDYVRADAFEVEEPGGLFSKARAVTHSVMVFRRAIRRPAPATRPAEAPAATAPPPRVDPPRPAAAQPAAQPRPQPQAPAQAQPAPSAEAATPYIAAPAPQQAAHPHFAEPPAPAPAPPRAQPRHEPGFSIAGVEPPRRDRDEG